MTLTIDGAKLKVNQDKSGFALKAVFHIDGPNPVNPLSSPMTVLINKSGTKFSVILHGDVWKLENPPAGTQPGVVPVAPVGLAHWTFAGDEAGVAYQAALRELGASYTLWLTAASGVNMAGISNPANLTITVGKDEGTVATLEGDDEDYVPPVAAGGKPWWPAGPSPAKKPAA
jgi:hypothetical protein